MAEAQHSKSRTGCAECKRKRVKCDEAKPVCGRCRRYPDRCDYGLKLSWTQGRPFKKKKQTSLSTELCGLFDATPAEQSQTQPDHSTILAEPPHYTELGSDTALSSDPVLSCQDHIDSDTSIGDLSFPSPELPPAIASTGQASITRDPFEDDVEEIVNLNHLDDESAITPFYSSELSEYSL